MRPLGAWVRRGTEQPLRSASAATEQPNSLSAAGRRRSRVKAGIVFLFVAFALKGFFLTSDFLTLNP